MPFLTPNDPTHVKPKNFMNYTAIAGAEIRGDSFRLTLDGSTHWLKNNAAQKDLIRRHKDDPEYAYAVKAAEVYSLHEKFAESVEKIERNSGVQPMTET